MLDINNINVKGKTLNGSLTKTIIIINSEGNKNVNHCNKVNISLKDNKMNYIHDMMNNDMEVNVTSSHFENYFFDNSRNINGRYRGVMCVNVFGLSQINFTNSTFSSCTAIVSNNSYIVCSDLKTAVDNIKKKEGNVLTVLSSSDDNIRWR